MSTMQKIFDNTVNTVQTDDFATTVNLDSFYRLVKNPSTSTTLLEDLYRTGHYAG